MDTNRVNTLQGTIRQVETDGHESLVTVQAEGETFTAFTNATPQIASLLAEGNPAILTFKAADMAVAKAFSGEISIRNHFRAAITAIEAGNILTELTLNYQGQTLYSIITNAAVNALNLKEGDAVTGLVKSTEITVNMI